MKIEHRMRIFNYRWKWNEKVSSFLILSSRVSFRCSSVASERESFFSLLSRQERDDFEMEWVSWVCVSLHSALWRREWRAKICESSKHNYVLLFRRNPHSAIRKDINSHVFLPAFKALRVSCTSNYSRRLAFVIPFETMQIAML